jgi:hypothetical protein
VIYHGRLKTEFFYNPNGLPTQFFHRPSFSISWHHYSHCLRDKHYVTNRAHLDGSIVKGHATEEVDEFRLDYMKHVLSRQAYLGQSMLRSFMVWERPERSRSLQVRLIMLLQGLIF